MSDAMGRMLAVLCLGCAVLSLSAPIHAGTIPLRVDVPVTQAPQAIPVRGGIPFPKGALASVDQVRLLGADGAEVPCQVTRTAVWPDGSVKWALVDVVLQAKQGQSFKLEYGPGVQRQAVSDPLQAKVQGETVLVTGGGVRALLKKAGGELAELSLDHRSVITAAQPARLVLNTVRIPDGTSGRALPTNTYLCRDPQAKLEQGEVDVETLALESAGPIRVTVLLRGHIRLPSFGTSLPRQLRQAPGRIPFSLRFSFYKGCGVVTGQHQIIFTGEPDCDYIARWGLRLPGQAGAQGKTILEPGVELKQTGSTLAVEEAPSRLCWAPLKDGLALIRRGWFERPCAVTQEAGAAVVDFWPSAAGLWDLRRYAREWAVGETGNVNNAAAMKQYAKVAAYGIAKGHDFVLSFGRGQDSASAQALSGQALLLAQPAWYGSTGALGGPFAPEQTSGPYAGLDRELRRQIDYYLYCQDLFHWHGKLVYGFWQSRYGQVHRHDRWERDYGRWGWSLNDGAGRVGHMLMLQFLRTLERRYFDAGLAFNRVNYDTNMVHTPLHFRGAKEWQPAQGCCHRHNVQPFGCPYVGMRGANPGGQRILYLLTGDGIMADGLNLVADAAFGYTEGHRGNLGQSGGSDGQGSAANALLWKYETTGEKKYLDACKQILDLSGLVPPKSGKRLGYGPAFGLFNAAGECADLLGDKAFQSRVVTLAQQGSQAKKPEQFVYALAMGWRFGQDEALKTRLATILKADAAKESTTLADLPPVRWPGHAGWRTASVAPNQARDYPYALAAVIGTGVSAWPRTQSSLKPIPATRPKGWYEAGGKQTAADKVSSATSLFNAQAGTGGGTVSAGAAEFVSGKNAIDQIKVGQATLLASAAVPYVTLVKPQAHDDRLVAAFTTHVGSMDRIGKQGDGLVGTGKAGPITFVISLRPAKVDGIPSVRVAMACKAPVMAGKVASWGLRLPLKLGNDKHLIQSTAPGRFRLERVRVDQNDERIPNWLTSETRRGPNMPLWPLWRAIGIQIGPGAYYRIWQANGVDTAPLFTDEGQGESNWLDITDRGARPRWGLTVRLLRPDSVATSLSRQAIRADLMGGVVEVQFLDSSAAPVSAAAGLSGAADLIAHDGWRAPLSKPELTAAQYEKFLDDLNYGGNYGLFALRFRLSHTHQVTGRKWAEMVRDHGIEPREILYGMQWHNGLAKHAAKIGVKADPKDVETTVKRIIEHYRK